MICPKANEIVKADDCEGCVTKRECYEWCLDHIVWGQQSNREPSFIHPMGKYGEGLGDILVPQVIENKRASQKEPIAPEVRWAVWERDNFTCQYCGVRRDLSVDHIVPESKGGGIEMANLQTLCSKCNSRKGDKNG